MNRITQQQLAAYFSVAQATEDNRFMVIQNVLIEATTLAWDDDEHELGKPMKNQHHVVTVWDAEGVFNPSEAEQLLATYKNSGEYMKAVYDFADKEEAMAFFWELGKRAWSSNLLAEIEGEKQV